ncbi:hypothetical protein NDU88_004452 [Pleurodeles waltl]|uniref:Uncharacterized protein n=1 Tax=Pleurodeles waltl TaxID=8319 RepID=A0AAV7MTH6_PLEWA|nr:hypothetical protein NDU88_004452 [Pleurodeles waltl]
MMGHQVIEQPLNSNDHGEEFAQPVRSTLDTLLIEIVDLKSTQTHEIAMIHERLSKIDEVMALLPQKLKEAKSRILASEDQVLSMQQEATQLTKSKNALEYKLQDLEYYNWCSNLHMLGVAEGSEGSQVREWTKFLLKQAIPELSGDITTTRAHRVPAQQIPAAKY